MGHTDEEALERFIACRDAGDEIGAKAAASELVELVHDRISGQVAIAARRTKVPLEEREDVVQEVHLSVIGAVHDFRGSSMGELHNLIKTVAHRRCVDQIRKRVRQRADAEHLAGTHWEPGEDDGRPHQGEIDQAWEQHTRTQERFDAKAFLEWALPQLDRRQRTVWERDADGVDAEATCVELRVTKANLYQLRRRANVKLQSLYREYF